MIFITIIIIWHMQLEPQCCSVANNRDLFLVVGWLVE
jgi:hypothetical protein